MNRGDQVADSDKIERYVSASLWWRDKDGDKVQKDGLKCGNYALTVDLNRLGEQMSEDEYIDFMFDGSKMRISEAQQHITKRTPFE